ncbi:Thiamine kinase [Microbulbifer aggregans]|uniref:Thiamine kinase n=1 Tax=Microbulbifer aggregans TaxID=1769779 RepID=A0A1C9W512_9GAMM|nr:choline kinase family protein [Microbulbifer aggregans]AOS96235.1 Thiamine kinase [Microbulbifer aggregans]
MSSTPHDIIPDDWHCWSDTKPSVIKKLAGGLTNQSYLIATPVDQLVLRRNSGISDALDLNRRAEANTLRLADEAGLCAPVIHCDTQCEYLVTRYIEGTNWRNEGCGSLKSLAALLRGIHRLPAINARLVVEEKIEKYWQSIDSRAEFYSVLHSLDHAIEQHLRKARALGEGESLCHNDLSAGNLILASTGQLYAIDWEYAAMGDSFYELAVITEEYGLVERQQERLLEEYLQRPLVLTDWQRLEHWRVIYGYLSVLWYAVQFSTESTRSPGLQRKIVNRAVQLSTLSAGVRR